MKEEKKSKKKLIAEMKTLLLRIEELEAIERKYRALTGKIQHLADHVAATDALQPVEVIKEGKRATILVVDDNDVFRKFMLDALQNEGYRVIAADSSAAALHIFESDEETVDLLITDIIMPDGSGTELYQQVHAAYPHIKVLFVSGYADEILVHTDVEKVIESDVAFLQKPFRVSELIEKVKQELGEKAANWES